MHSHAQVADEAGLLSPHLVPLPFSSPVPPPSLPYSELLGGVSEHIRDALRGLRDDPYLLYKDPEEVCPLPSYFTCS